MPDPERKDGDPLSAERAGAGWKPGAGQEPGSAATRNLHFTDLPSMRVLFVDDDPLAVMLLRRQFRPLEQEWEMDFAESGEDALALLAERPFDAVISDLRMPGMDGAELLQQVVQRQPQAIRLIHSGEVDSRLMLKCVGVAHQYLAKPCDPRVVRSLLQRLGTQAAAFNHSSLRSLIPRLEHIPSVPALYCQIMDELQRPDATLEDVGRIVAQDPGMTAKILKITNSAFLGLRREVVDPVDAVGYIGIEMLKSLVLVFQVFSHYEGHALPGFSIEALWSHSLATAITARSIAQAESADPACVHQASLAGLLHDVGKLILAANLRDEYTAVVTQAANTSREAVTCEREMLGATHADVAGYLLGLWGLPTPVVEAIAGHHTPRECTREGFCPVIAVHAADAIVHRQRGDAASAPLDTELLSELQLDERLELWETLGDHSVLAPVSL